MNVSSRSYKYSKNGNISGDIIALTSPSLLPRADTLVGWRDMRSSAGYRGHGTRTEWQTYAAKDRKQRPAAPKHSDVVTCSTRGTCPQPQSGLHAMHGHGDTESLKSEKNVWFMGWRANYTKQEGGPRSSGCPCSWVRKFQAKFAVENELISQSFQEASLTNPHQRLCPRTPLVIFVSLSQISSAPNFKYWLGL